MQLQGQFEIGDLVIYKRIFSFYYNSIGVIINIVNNADYYKYQIFLAKHDKIILARNGDMIYFE